MSRIESGFIPLPIVESGVTSDRVYLKLNLPQYLDQDRIGVNIGRIEKLQKLSGIALTAVKGVASDEVSSENHEIIGVGPDGSALASKAKSKTTVPAMNTFMKDEFNPFSRLDSRSIALAMELNVSEITSRIQLSNKNLRDSEEWSKQVDEALREKLRKEGTNNLVKQNGFEKLWFPFAWGGIPSLFIAAGIIPISYYTTIYSLDKIFTIMKKRIYPETRLSIFPSYAPQLDRAAVLQLKTRTQKLVADIPTEGKE